MNHAKISDWLRGAFGVASGFFLFVAAMRYMALCAYVERPIGDPAVVLCGIGMAIFWLLAAIYCQHWAKP